MRKSKTPDCPKCANNFEVVEPLERSAMRYRCMKCQTCFDQPSGKASSFIARETVRRATLAMASRAIGKLNEDRDERLVKLVRDQLAGAVGAARRCAEVGR